MVKWFTFILFITGFLPTKEKKTQQDPAFMTTAYNAIKERFFSLQSCKGIWGNN
jgi:hypothetical protein